MFNKIIIFIVISIFFLFLFTQIFLNNPIASDVLITSINQIRKSNNLLPLKENSNLYNSAINKAFDMSKKKYWSHTDSQGRSFDWWINNSGYDFLSAGENLARYFFNDQNMIEAWMKSPSHRDNILSSKFTEIGIGRCDKYVVLHFGNNYLSQLRIFF
jgi:uncharacterized protein YkwD